MSVIDEQLVQVALNALKPRRDRRCFQVEHGSSYLCEPRSICIDSIATGRRTLTFGKKNSVSLFPVAETLQGLLCPIVSALGPVAQG